MPKRSAAILILAMLLISNITSFGFARDDEKYKTLLKERYGTSDEETRPFAVVARNSTDFEKLRKTHPKLPKAETIDFKKFAVIAAYVVLPTPCHDLRFQKDGNLVTISKQGPPKDMMCTQVLLGGVIVKLIPARPKEKLKVVFSY